MKYEITEKRKRKKTTTLSGDFHNPLLTTDERNREKIITDLKDLFNSINQIDLIDT